MESDAGAEGSARELVSSVVDLVEADSVVDEEHPDASLSSGVLCLEKAISLI